MNQDDLIDVTLEAGEDDENNNFVEEQLGSISGTVLEDTDNDDEGDEPIEGIEITLTDVDSGATQTTTTDENGFYEFTDLEPGDYTVTEQDEAEIDEDYVDVFDGDESDDGDVNDGVLNQDDLIDVTLEAGEDDENNNFVEELNLADLSLIKSVDIARPQVGERVTFTITVSNDGPDDATGVAVSDTIPSGYINIDDVDNGGVNNVGVLEWTSLEIADGESIDLTFTAEVIAPAEGVDYQNIAQVDAADQSDPDSDPGNPGDTDGDGVVGPLDDDGSLDPDDEDDGDDASVEPQVADLSLVKTVSNETPNVGEEITFTITVSNAGPNDATGVAVSDTVPSGYSAVANADNGGDINGNLVTWTDLVVPADGEVILTFTAEVVAPAEGVDYQNIAQVDASDQYDPDSEPGNPGDTDGDGDVGPLDDDGSIDPDDEDDGDDASVDPQIADLSLIKTVSTDYALVGQEITFTITVSNDGPNDATGVAVSDTVPSGYTAVANADNDGDINGNLVTWSDLTIPAGGEVTLTFTAEVVAPGEGIDYQNIAQVDASDQYDPDSNPGNPGDTDGDGDVGPLDDDGSIDPDDEDDGDDATIEPQLPGIVIEKATNGEDADETPGVFIPFQNGLTPPDVTWTYVVTNTGNTDLENVVVTDDIEGEVCVIPFIAAGESESCEFVGVTTSGQYTNMGTATGQPIDPDGQPLGDPIMDDDPSNYFGLRFNIEKVADKDTICAGEEVQYEVAIRIFDAPPGIEFRNLRFYDDVLDRTITPADSIEFMLEGDTNGDGILQIGEGATSGDTLAQWVFKYALTLDETTTNSVMDTFEIWFDDGMFEFPIDTAMGADTVTVVVDEAKCAKIGDQVWEDANANGLLDPSEDGINGVTVNLYEDADMNGAPDGDAIATTVTDMDNGEAGFYQFTGLIPGKYVVEFIPIDGYVLTSTDASGMSGDGDADAADDSDANEDTGFSHSIELVTSECEEKVDAGIVGLLSLGNMVWLDNDNNGMMDDGELGIDGVTMTLWIDENNDDVPDVNTGMTDVTANNGKYLFEGLAPGNYIVQVGPENFEAGAILEGFSTSTGNDPVTDADDDINNDDDGYDPGIEIGIISTAVTLTSGEEPNNDGDDDRNSNLSVDFSFFESVSIGDYVWNDEDGDGVQDDEEEGINDVVVNLYNTDDELVGTMMTMQNPNNAEEQGYYFFENLPPGDYYVEFITPIGFIPTQQDDPAGDDVDSDVDGSNGPNTTPTYTLNPGDINPTVDAGYSRPAMIGDFVWLDSGDVPNVQDDNDSGLNGVVVKLFKDGVNIAETITGPLPENHPDFEEGQPLPNGYYLFDNLAPGNYSVMFVQPSAEFSYVVPNSGGDDNTDSDVVDIFNQMTLAFAVNPADTLLDIDAGFTSATVPVEFLSFSGEWNEESDVNELTWSTATEVNNEYFVIERSVNGGVFTDVGTVQGAGNSTQVLTYDFDDEDISQNGDYAYRIRQVDYDGAYDYSKTIVIRVQRDILMDASVYPNPASQFLTIDLQAGVRSDVTVHLLDVEGRLIKSNLIEAQEIDGKEKFRVNITDIEAGTYILRVSIGAKVFSHKVLFIGR